MIANDQSCAGRRSFQCIGCERIYDDKAQAKACRCDEKIKVVVLCGKCGSCWHDDPNECYTCGSKLK